ncbi:MAG: RES domain-containing protein [Steroidobacteraceae bacterium]
MAAGTLFARIYFATGPYPSRWSQFRHFGPTAARWDHHLPSAGGAPKDQDRAILYCASDVDTCAAEVPGHPPNRPDSQRADSRRLCFCRRR